MRRMSVLWAVLLACGVCFAGEDLKPDAEGFIRDWLMLAPIDISDGAGSAEETDKEQTPGEGKLAPKEGDKLAVKGKELTWKKISAKEYYFDVNELLGDSHQNVAGYFVAYLSVPEELKGIKLKMGSNDQGKVYLNEKEVLKFTETRTIDKDLDTAEVTLNKGVNKVVFKVINDSNNWQGCIRFTTADGKAVTGFTVKFAP